MFTLWSLIKAILLLVNACAIINERRVLKPCICFLVMTFQRWIDWVMITLTRWLGKSWYQTRCKSHEESDDYDVDDSSLHAMYVIEFGFVSCVNSPIDHCQYLVHYPWSVDRINEGVSSCFDVNVCVYMFYIVWRTRSICGRLKEWYFLKWIIVDLCCDSRRDE